MINIHPVACWLQNNLGRKVLMSFYSWVHWGTKRWNNILTLWTSWRDRFLNQAFASGVLELSHNAVMSFWHHTRFKIKVKCVRLVDYSCFNGVGYFKTKTTQRNEYILTWHILVGFHLFKLFSVHWWCLNPLEKTKTMHRAQSGPFEMPKN